MSPTQEKAEKAIRESLPAEDVERVLRTELAGPDGTLLVYFRPAGPEAEADPLDLLRRNASPLLWGLEAPLVYDPLTGRPARRVAFPYRLWSSPERMQKRFRSEDFGAESARRDYAGLRLLKGVPTEAAGLRYGRGGRLSLVLDGPLPLLAVEVFPGGLSDADWRQTQADLRQAAWVLLARSGVSAGTRSFHMLRAADFFRVERSAAVPEPSGSAAFSRLEHELLREAEEDRRITAMLLCEDFSWLRLNVEPNRQQRR